MQNYKLFNLRSLPQQMTVDDLATLLVYEADLTSTGAYATDIDSKDNKRLWAMTQYKGPFVKARDSDNTIVYELTDDGSAFIDHDGLEHPSTLSSSTVCLYNIFQIFDDLTFEIINDSGSATDHAYARCKGMNGVL